MQPAFHFTMCTCIFNPFTMCILFVYVLRHNDEIINMYIHTYLGEIANAMIWSVENSLFIIHTVIRIYKNSSMYEQYLQKIILFFLSFSFLTNVV